MSWSLDRTNFNRNIAVVIGINNYQNGIHPLKTAVNDAKAIANLLEQEYEYQQVIRLFPDRNEATLPQLNQLLFETLPQKIKPTEGDRLLFYFAGHGIARNSEEGPAGAIIPQDAQLGEWETYLPMKKLNEALSQLDCHHLLVVLDCCFAGNFRWSSRRNVIPAFETIHREHYDRFIRYPAWQAITSAAHNQEALDYTDERGIAPDALHSPFAKALINGLKDMKADFTGDGVITAPELYLYLRDNLIGKDGSSELQTAGLWPLQKHDRGEFIFTLPGFVPEQLKPAPPLDASKNPYRGLESFDEKHSQLFFGRTELVNKLQDFVKIHALSVVLGASGSGKSSLVKAGLIPKLRKETTEEWYILPPIRPGETPLIALNNALQEAQFPEVTVPNPQQNLAHRIDIWAKNNPNSKLLLLIDQSEEIITLCQNEDDRKQFFQQILTAIDAHRDKLRVVLSLRSDFEPQVRDAGFQFIPKGYSVKQTELKNRWKNGRFMVSPMTRGELREAIQKPAEARVMFFQPQELVEQLIDEVADMPGALPLLSFALSELYLKYLERQRQAEIKGEIIERTMIQSDYQELGGVILSLTQKADEEYQTLVAKDSAFEQVIRHVMLRMVALGGGELARRRVPLLELEYPPEKNDLVKEVIERFTKARLLVTGEDAEGNLYVEPAHDALVRGWQKLLMWKQEDEEGLILQRRLTPAAEEWKKQQQVRFLWNANPRLDLLKKVSLSDQNWLNQVEAEFVQRSVRKKRSNTIVRWSIAGSVLLGAMIFSAAIWMQWRNSELNNANSLGRYSLSLFAEHKKMEAFVEVIRAGKILQKHKARDPQVITALQKVLYEGRERNHLQEHDQPVSSVSFSPDGQTLASSTGDIGSSSGDNTIKLWNLETGRVIRTLQGHDDYVSSVSFSPDGQTLATGSHDNTIKLWNLETGELIRTLQGHTEFVTSISFSPGGQTLASGSGDNTIKLWNLETGKEIRTLQGHTEVVRSVSFSPDGQTLASGSFDRTIKLWNLETGEVIRTLQGHTEWVESVSFSPDGQTLASGSFDQTIKLWDPTGTEIHTLQGHTELVESVSSSPDGQTLASGSRDSTIKLWNLETGELIRTLQGHDGDVNSVSFSPDGQTLASGSFDRTIKLWNLETG
ncbi:MAG: caspase family protein [Microcoleaceae cyanobacterium]